MTRAEFERRVAEDLRRHARRYPDMQPQDAVKLVFQALLGVGHLLGDRETVTAYIARETEGLSADPDEPLFERIGPAWCRLNLRRAMAEGLTPDMIAGMMLASDSVCPFTRQDVDALCRSLAREGLFVMPERASEQIRDADWLPSHSPGYRARYHPAYRVVSADWIPCGEALGRIARAQAGTDRLLVTLDGPCATGKTTLAHQLAQMLRAAVIHTDDFVIPHARKTPEQMAIPGGNCDAERLAAEVTEPWKRGDPVRYRRYAFREDRLLPAETLPPACALILEGSYCNLPVLRACADVRLFLDAPWPLREARLRERESPKYLQGFYDRWIPLEDAYFDAFHLPDGDCVVIRAGGE